MAKYSIDVKFSKNGTRVGTIVSSNGKTVTTSMGVNRASDLLNMFNNLASGMKGSVVNVYNRKGKLSYTGKLGGKLKAVK